jgi:hypothetical protein
MLKYLLSALFVFNFFINAIEIDTFGKYAVRIVLDDHVYLVSEIIHDNNNCPKCNNDDLNRQ